MNQYPSENHLASWATVCPGNNESAGKRKRGKTRKGNLWLKGSLTQAAWGAIHAKHNYLSAQYHRLVGRLGKKRATLAVDHSILEIIYHILKEQVPYEELGADYFEKKNRDRLAKNYLNKLKQLGYSVTLAEKPNVA